MIPVITGRPCGVLANPWGQRTFPRKEDRNRPELVDRGLNRGDLLKQEFSRDIGGKAHEGDSTAG